MDLTEYINGTKDTWNYFPIETHQNMNYRLQIDNAIKGITGEILELHEKKESITSTTEDVIDESGDVIYYIVIAYDLCSFLSTFEETVKTLQTVISNFDDMQLIAYTDVLYYQTLNYVLQPTFWKNIKNPLYREGKEFDLDFIGDYVSTCLFYVLCLLRSLNIELFEVLEYNYDKLHDKDNLGKRGLKLNEQV